MDKLDRNKPIWQLTVGELLSLQEEMMSHFNTPIQKREYEYGIVGICRIFGCSKTKANQIKASGIIDDAIYQNAGTIIVDKQKALELFGDKKTS